ncbi:hypothetical protein BH20VER3_BH20VER3_02440 [soil metagenome]
MVSSNNSGFFRKADINKILEAAAELQTFCKEQHYRFCFIGGLAVQRWGEPRVTNDADLTLMTGWGEEEKFIEALLARFRARHTDSMEFALRRRVLLLTASNDVPLDIALAAIPFEERSVERASPWKVSDRLYITTCSAEDLLIHKVFAGRGLDWLDVERILQRQNKKLNFDLIFEELRPLLELKEEPENEEQLRQLMAREGLL